MKVKLKDIADNTGYSISTVSRVLNGSYEIGKEARQKILKSADELQYPVNKAKLIPDRKTLQYALITDFHPGEFYASYFYGINKAAKNEGVRLMLISVEDPHKDVSNLITDLSPKSLDGAIIFTPELNHQEHDKIRELMDPDIPIVSHSLLHNPSIHTITFDGYTAGHLVADHFEQKGYNEVAIIKGPFSKAETRFRYNGFRDYIQQSSQLDMVAEFEGDFNFEGGKEAFESFQKLDRKPRAIFASNDLMAHGFMVHAKYFGYHFPDDIALIGYDDLPMCEHNYPKISSVRTDFKSLGLSTFQKLKDMITGSNQHQGKLNLISVDLIERDTT